jgi:hypothetical protein
MAPTYAATKAGLRLFAEALGLRLSKHGVTVTLVSPGFVDTPMSRKVKEAKPFLMTADAAAAVIARGIAAKKRVIVVPWQFAVIRTHRSVTPGAGALGPVARMTATPDLDRNLTGAAVCQPKFESNSALGRSAGAVGDHRPQAQLTGIGVEIWIARPANGLLHPAGAAILPAAVRRLFRLSHQGGETPPMKVILRKRAQHLHADSRGFFYFWAQACRSRPACWCMASRIPPCLGGAGLLMVYVMVLLLLATGGLTIPSAFNANGWLYARGDSALIPCRAGAGPQKLTALSSADRHDPASISPALPCAAVEFGPGSCRVAAPAAASCTVALRLVVTRLPGAQQRPDLVGGIAAAGMTKLGRPGRHGAGIPAAADLIPRPRWRVCLAAGPRRGDAHSDAQSFDLLPLAAAGLRRPDCCGVARLMAGMTTALRRAIS